MSSTDRNDPLLTTKQVSEYLAIKESTLITWRCTRNVEIPYIKIGGCVRYRKSQLEQYLDRCVQCA